MQEKLKDLSRLLLTNRIKLISVESCTGGTLASICTDLEGSSNWFEGGIVTYSNKFKSTFVGVSQLLLQEHGAVSEPVATAMAQGALRHFPKAMSVAITGIAGPSGASNDKPLGRVYIAVAFADSIQSRKYTFAGDRQQVRLQSCQQAIQLLTSRLRTME